MSNRAGWEELKPSEPHLEAGRVAYEDRGKD
jgi:hypothetical protein